MIQRKALSPVISSLILSAAVIAIGGGVWSYSIGASTAVSEGYVNSTLELLNEVTERFVVEHVCYDSGTDTLNITVYNYGDQQITVDAYANITTSTMSFMETYYGKVIQKGESIRIDISMSETVVSDDKAAIKLNSRRQNNAYKLYYFP